MQLNWNGAPVCLGTLTSGAPQDTANFWTDFRTLPAALPFPAALLPPAAHVFSSVFRVATPGLQLWTHYDVMDNVLIQVGLLLAAAVCCCCCCCCCCYCCCCWCAGAGAAVAVVLVMANVCLCFR